MLQEAVCYRALGKDRLSMRALSKLINYPVASSLRLEAMYLRALIYESQGRGHLAQRQLEALAEKRGKWAEKAKKKVLTYGS